MFGSISSSVLALRTQIGDFWESTAKLNQDHSSLSCMRWPLVVAVMLGLTTLAGCSSGPTEIAGNGVHLQPRERDSTGDVASASPRVPRTTGSTTVSEHPQGKTSDERGAIRGVVVDAAIKPLAGAVVELVGQHRNVTTLESGEFAFDLLEPGTYFVEAKAARYLVAQNSVQVVAGKSEPVRIILEGDGVPYPRHVTEKFVGHADFDLGVVVEDSLPMQCLCNWTIYPEPGFKTFVVEGSGSTSTPRPPDTGQPLLEGQTLRQIYWTFLDKEQTHGTGYNYTDFPFTSHVAGDKFTDATSEITVTVGGGFLPPGQMQFDIFVTTFYVDPAPPGWSLINGDK